MEADVTYEELVVKFKNCDIDNRKYRVHFNQQLCNYLGFEEPDIKLKSLSLEHTYSKCQNIVRLKYIKDTYRHSQDIRIANLINTNAIIVNRIYSFIHNGRITTILTTGTDINKSQSFAFDHRGFLEQEITNTTNFRYLYDSNGNITSILDLVNYSSIALTYDNSTSGLWADRLLSYDGKEIKYDPKFLGNPKYFGTFNGQGELISGITYGWEGKNLTYYHNSETQKEITYAYNDANLRISKTVNSVLTSYTYEGNRLVMEQSGTKTKRFLYDEMGLLIGFSYQIGTSYARYFYIRDQLGHILGLIDATGTVVVRYTYDAWGNILSVTGSLASTIGQENPFRYKGYYYDSETGYYYCQSRYYVPLWCRWLSSDKVSYLNPESINGINLYMYCGNNPVMYLDPSGKFVITSFLIGMGIAALIGMGVGAFSYTVSEVISFGLTGEWSWSWGLFAGSTLGGGITGALSFAAPWLSIPGAAAVNGFLSNTLGMAFQNSLGEANHCLADIFLTSTVIGGLSALTAGITNKIRFTGFTGRGSISQVARQISTKFFHGTIGRITAKTLGKMVAYELAYSVFYSVIGGIWSVFEANSREEGRSSNPRITIPIIDY